ncbi:MAG: hypothetical protein EOO50_14630, partial [Flavobacterium sp.]|uniref:beta strand repeat-containing protein n=1 Tax=Flavobacterium sp. TaxID=239 RepID=UPI001207FD00
MKSTLPDSDLNQTFGKAGVGRKNLATLPERRFMGLFTLLVALLVLSTGNAQISYSSAASDYTQNFNDLLSPVPSNGTLIAPSVLPGGWQFVEAGANANGSANLRVDNGTSSTGDTFFYGATSSNERALGSYASGSLTSQYGAVFTNDTGAPLTQFTLTYTGEQWRDGGNASAVFNKLTFAYAINSSSVTSGTFTNVSNLDFTAPVNNTTADAAKDGNAAGFRTTLTYTVTGINWPAGQNLVIRWTDINDAGNDDGLAIDDITFSATGASVPAIATIGTLSAVNTTYGTASPTPTSYTVSGSNLGTTDITITAPAGFEISKNGATGTYATSQTLTPASGSVATTTIYVRLAATTPAGTYSGNITHISGTATSDKATASSTVAQKGLTVSGATAQNKTYDRTIAATITGATPVGTVNGDAITLTGGGTFGDFLVENGKAVTSNLVVSGTNASSYALAQPTGLTADITPKDLTLSSVSASDKTYDGSNEAILTATLNGVISPDEVVLNASASFANSFVANNIPVTSFSTIFGADAANYNLIQPSGLTADITAKALTILNATAQNKVYDGNTTAVITGTLDGVIAPDDVVLTLQGTFASPEVGLGIAVTSTSFITGDISNYTLTQPTGLTANISAGELLDQTITFAALADVTYGTAAFNLTASASSNLTVSYSSSNENVATVSGNVVTVLNAGSTTITATQTGDLTYDSAEPVAQALMVLPKELTITSATAQNKEYDGNDDAVITGTLSGVINSDDVTVTLSADFATAFVGTDIEVTSTSTLGGTEVSNYTLSQPTGLNADITAKTLTVENAVASDKPYDGNPIATIIGGDLIGIVNNDDVSLSNADGLFATSDAAINIEVTTAFTLTGSAATNYALTQPTGLFADITPLQVTVFGVTAQNKVYDGNANATVSGTPELDGVLAGDTVTVSGTPTGLFDNKNVGTSKPITVSGYTLSGAQAGNYTAIQPTDVSADITPASLTILNAQAVDKSFDGTTAATITGTLQGVISPDVATLVGTGTFAQSAIGTDIAVTSTSTVGGAAGLNYIINPQPTGLTADIVAGPSILAIGDLSILGFQYNAPDTFAFVTWVDLAENTIIKFTDNAFLSSGSANATNNARGGENFVIWRNNG